MKTRYTVLVEGYAQETKNGWRASSTCTLIRDSGKLIVVDPGINRMALDDALRGVLLDSSAIDMVFLTHYHLDHAFLVSAFGGVPVLDRDFIYRDDEEVPYGEFLPDTGIKVIPTPGHCSEHASLAFETKKEGIVCVAGDVFWWADDEVQDTSARELLLDRIDPFAQNMDDLRKSQIDILDHADIIIPGHGKPFLASP